MPFLSTSKSVKIGVDGIGWDIGPAEDGWGIVGFCDAVGGFIVVNMNCESIWMCLPLGEISGVACSMFGLDGYGFGGAVVEVVDGDDTRWWKFHEKGRNNGIFVGND